MQNMVKFSLSDNVQHGTIMVSGNGAVREDTPCAKLDFFLKSFSDMTKAQVSYSEVENARTRGGPPFWCLPLVPPLLPAVWLTVLLVELPTSFRAPWKCHHVALLGKICKATESAIE